MKSPFRSIRQKLFTEGKLVRYLGYAVGEILLIIVGIMIALDLNNWNEDRKEQVEFDAYVVQLREDVQTAREMNQGISEYNKQRAEGGYSLIEFLEAEDRSEETLSHLEYDLNRLGYYQGPVFHVGLLGELLNGKTDTISRDPELHRKSMELVSDLLMRQKIVESVILNIIEHRSHLAKFIAPRHPSIPNMELNYDISELENSREFKFLIQNIIRRQATVRDNAERVVRYLEDFLAVLEEYE